MIKKILYDEFISGKKIYDWLMLGFGILLQLIVIVTDIITGTFENIGLVISNLTGVIFVILCAQGKISSFVFHVIHIVTYIIYFVVPNCLWGELIENCMYIITDIIGTYTWLKLYSHKTNNQKNITKVKAKVLGINKNILVAFVFILGVLLHWTLLKNIPMFGKLDSQPFLDSLTSVPAYIGQVLLVLGYTEQWFYWFILDFCSIFLAIRAGSFLMSMQFAFWSFNCVYGFISWYKSTKENLSA